MKPTLTIIVPSRDLDGMLAACLRHAAAAAAAADLPPPDLAVLDNASRFPTPPGMEDTPAYRLCRFDAPRGFAASCNHAAAEATTDYLLFLNNDVLLARRALTSLFDAFRLQAGLAICGARLIFPDATIQHAGVRFGPGEIGPYHAFRRLPSTLAPRTVEVFQAVTGACLLIPRKTFAALGGFDESYPFGLEDIDLCLRARQAGGEIRCRQDTESIHFESMTPGRPALDVPSRALFMERWKGRYAIDG